MNPAYTVRESDGVVALTFGVLNGSIDGLFIIKLNTIDGSANEGIQAVSYFYLRDIKMKEFESLIW